jgi:hypothetical protein
VAYIESQSHKQVCPAVCIATFPAGRVLFNPKAT